MIGWRKLIVLVLCLSALMVGATYMSGKDMEGIYSSFVWGVVCLGGSYFAGNAGISIFESIKNKRSIPGVKTSHSESITETKTSTEAGKTI